MEFIKFFYERSDEALFLNFVLQSRKVFESLLLKQELLNFASRRQRIGIFKFDVFWVFESGKSVFAVGFHVVDCDGSTFVKLYKICYRNKKKITAANLNIDSNFFVKTL